LDDGRGVKGGRQGIFSRGMCEGDERKEERHARTQAHIHARIYRESDVGKRRRGWKGKNDIYKTQGHKCDCGRSRW